MSRHEGVSCDSCNKSNFCGKRYKCLICFDYDLCSTCHDNGTTTTRHTATHAMQCIMTRSDFELFYGGESSILLDNQPSSYSFVCPHCGKLGLSETTLFEHVSASHTNTTIDVICPICAALPGGDPNHVTDDLMIHLSIEHRADTGRETEEPMGRNIRRLFHQTTRNIPAIRSRRTVQQLAANLSVSSSVVSSLSNAGATFSSARENIDPIAELLSQLSGVRRVAQQQSAAISASQLSILQQKLQFERQQVQQARDRLERLPRKQATPSTNATPANKKANKAENASSDKNKYLLAQYYSELDSKEKSKESMEERDKQSGFIRELVYSVLEPDITSLDIQNTEKKDSTEATEEFEKEDSMIVEEIEVQQEALCSLPVEENKFDSKREDLHLKKQCSTVDVFLTADDSNGAS